MQGRGHGRGDHARLPGVDGDETQKTGTNEHTLQEDCTASVFEGFVVEL